MKIKDMIKRTIASNIKRARIASNMTQAEAADRLGITAQAVSNFERGINSIESSLLLRMCEIYNTSMSNILGEENEQKKFSPGKVELTERDLEMLQIFRLIPEEWQQIFLEQGRAFANSLKKD